MHEIRHIAASALLSEYEGHPDVRILRRISALDDLPLAPRGDGLIRRIGVVDVETTGTDPQIDEIIDIAVVMLEVSAAGEIVGVASAGQAMRDPGMPIPPHITRITGISDADVLRKAIDLDRLEARLASADALIAHNCAFDAAFIGNLMPGLAEAPWACSANDFDWLGSGFDGRKLHHLLMQIGRFADAHRAMVDVVALIHLLAHRLPHGGTVLGDLLANAEQSTIRIEAIAAPFGKRSVLKARGYRWDASRRVWWREIGDDQCAGEEMWLREHVTPQGPMPRMTAITWHERHR